MAQKLLGSRLLANSGWFNERATASGWFFGELVADVSSGGSPVDPVLVTSVTSSATGNVTTSYSQALASTTTGDLNIIAINVSPQANLTDPGVPTIDGVAVDATPGNTAGGWTTIGTAWDSGSPGPRMTVVYRVRQAGDPSSVTIAWTNVGNYATVVSAFQAGTFDTSTPVEQAAIQNQAATSTSFPLPSMTTTVRGSALYFASNRSTGTWTMPGTLINHAENASTANIATAYDTAANAHTESPTATHTASTGAGNTAIASLKSNASTTVTLPAETGAGSDAVAANAAVPLADPRTGVDAIALAATVTLTADAGTGADATTVAAAVPLADARTATDALGAPSATVPLPAESGTATDALSVSGSASPNLPDAGTATDAIHATVTAATADTGTGTDAATTAAAVPLADSGAGADALTVSGSSSPNLPDTATATDALTVTVALTIADTRPSATDTLTTAAAVGFADTAAAADLLVAQITAYLADTAAAVDSVTAVAGSGIETGRAEGAAAASAGAGGGTAATTVLEASQPAAWPARGSDGATPAATSGNPSTPRAGG